MKNLIALIGILTLICGTPAVAAEKLLTDRQLDKVTAGSGGENAQQAVYDNTIEPKIIDPYVDNKIDSQGAEALNVVNTPSVNVNNSVDASQNADSRNRYLILKDGAQKDVKAVNIVNSIEGQVANGLNVHANGLRPDLFSGGSSGGSLNNLYQTNIINQNHN